MNIDMTKIRDTNELACHECGKCCSVTDWMNDSQISRRMRTQRIGEASAAGVDLLITACPKCQIHFQCALVDKELNKSRNLAIKDITEGLAENLH